MEFLSPCLPSSNEQMRPRQSQLSNLAKLIALLWMLLHAPLAIGQQNLPSMGERADIALSPIEERELGSQFMRQIRASLPLVSDVQLNEYIQNLGARLVMAAGNQDVNNFHFFIIDDPQINAFAIPGGYVGVNTGLIAAMDQEEQLASVVAHEVAHVTQRHHARTFATGNRASLSAAAAVLAAIIIGQASPQAGQAALAAGLAASQQSAINFTRANEVEADRIGIEILTNAQYDARAMAETFAILRRKNSLNTSNRQLEYLRTHPLDNNRIAEATDRADGKSTKPRVPAIDYQLFQARMEVLSSRDLAKIQRYYHAEHRKSPKTHTAYALALISHQANRSDEAKRYLEELDSLSSTHAMIELLRADINARNNSKETLKRLKAMSELYPERYSIVEKRLEFLVDQRQLSRAIDVANNYIRGSAKPNPLAWRELASIQQQLNDRAGSHESLSRFFESLGELEQATEQLQLALREVQSESQDSFRLNARLKRLQELASQFRQ